jgi:16S rRNA (cytosine967-C5)-methyltransferase
MSPGARRAQAAKTSSGNTRKGQLAPGAETLAAAAVAVREVRYQGRSADAALESLAGRNDRAAVRAIALGTLRWYLRLEPAIVPLLNRPASELSPSLAALLVTTAHQVEYSRGAPEAQVHLAVDASRVLGESRASGMVNAVMRRFVAERARLMAGIDADPAVRHAHPGWFVEELRQAWGARAEPMLAANNQHPPMVLRTDPAQMTAADFLRAWRAQGRDAHTLEWNPDAVVLERPAPVHALPGFEFGAVSVQDAGAQLAALLLDAAPGMQVLDACAAPGGKTLHLAQRTPDLAELVAVDDDPSRLARVRENLDRGRRQARLIVADLAAPVPALQGARFDRILVDAPCSGTGVIRRHPDIKLLRRPTDIAAFADTQGRILRTVFELLKPAGRLVYVTCSVLPAENEAVVSSFVSSEPRAKLADWPAGVRKPPGLEPRRAGWQLLPGGDAGTDGFYYACLTRHEDPARP